jgi:hypothetical protein
MIVESSLDQNKNLNQTPDLKQKKNEIMPDQDFKYLDFINSINTTERKKLIRSLMVSRDYTPAMIRNELILFESRSILQRRGHHVYVIPGNSNSHTNLGYCYYNSITSLSRGYKYVEGYVRFKISGDYVAHSWNCDYKGNHFDFTYKDPENFEYFGVVVPDILVWKVVKKINLNHILFYHF